MQEQIAFSDGNPIAEISIFFVVFFLALTFVGIPGARSYLQIAADKIIWLVHRRNALPMASLKFELIKLDSVRIIVGGVALFRYGDILLASFPAGNNATLILAGCASLASAMIAVGFLTRLASLALMASANTVIDNYLGASTLGTMVMSMVLLIFVIAPAGSTLSVDSRLWPNRTTPTINQVTIAKLAGLLAYYCVCVYSVSWHTQDDAWLSGYVIGWVLLSPAANPKYSELAWWIHELSPWLYVNFARISIAGMFAWYTLVLPGLFFGWVTRYFVIFWGLAFFLISTFVLPLSYLGWYELCLWALLFLPSLGSLKKKANSPIQPSKIDRFSSGLLVTLVLLVAVFVGRMPILTLEPDQRPPGSWLKSTFAASPAAFGIHKINVFNTQDLSVFTFQWKNYIAVHGVDLSDENFSLADLRPLPSGTFVMTDVARYGISRHSRRVSRTDIGCDRQYWESILPFIKQSVQALPGQPRINEIISARFISTWPTATDFASYAALKRQQLPLCGAHLDLQHATVKQLVFYQDGLDESLRRRGYGPILDSENFEAVPAYPCAYDGRFLWALASGRPDLQNDEELLKGIQSVTVSKFGRFQLDCLLEMHDITQQWGPALLSGFLPSKDACVAGIALIKDLDRAAKFTPGVSLGDLPAKAETTMHDGDINSCIALSIEGRNRYWNAITAKPINLSGKVDES
ncbi:hypothetical protein [Neorhizobium galegae]|uniref:Uncharacterized protein n=1 Tax=Neorhizobium galegae bv. officinalis TaxID=323656 RepID=A0A0T7GSR0_NEOGA|nr:hypothetical protein [Neorhizobium galegae]CDZ50323.1 Hypothetical protein NGAL_HAMBI1189_33980 [Neorhizobium galegae bv. officinalis]